MEEAIEARDGVLGFFPVDQILGEVRDVEARACCGVLHGLETGISAGCVKW